jgi:phage-related protein (TIGR01555 family)
MAPRKLAPVKTTTKDSFENLHADLGIGVNKLTSGGTYGFNPITRDRMLLEFAYRGSWIVRAAVKTIADDMTREGIAITSSIDPKDIDKIEQGLSRLKIWQAFNENICWARLYGGSVGVIMVDGQKMDTPLNITSVGKGQFKGVAVLDRWMIEPPAGDVIKDLGPDIGKPRIYHIIGDSLKLPKQTVHHSRIIRFDGDDLPYYQRVAENGWGLSVLEPIFDRLIQFDSATAGAAQLIFKAHLRTMKIKKLREIISAGGKAYGALLKQMENIRVFQSSEGLSVIDSEDDIEVNTYTFAGLAEIIEQFASQLSGSLGIPVTRLFGQSPGGLNSTGQSDLQTYYDKIRQLQEDNERTDVLKILQLTHASELGRPAEPDLNFTFKSLWQIDEGGKADIATKTSGTIVSVFQAGIIDRAIALKELKQSSDVTNVFSNITDQDIEKAKLDPPPGAAMMGVPGAPQPDLGQTGAPPKPGEAQGELKPAAAPSAQAAEKPAVTSLKAVVKPPDALQAAREKLATHSSAIDPDRVRKLVGIGK